MIEYRGSIPGHGTAKLKNDPGLSDRTNIALKGLLAQKRKIEQPSCNIDTGEQDKAITAGNKEDQKSIHARNIIKIYQSLI